MEAEKKLYEETSEKDAESKNASEADAGVEGETPPELDRFVDNPYVSIIRNGKLVYTNRFYFEMHRLVNQEHMSPVDAYRSLGFDTDVLGLDRAYSAARRAKAMAEKGALKEEDEEAAVDEQEAASVEQEEIPAEILELLQNCPFIKGYSKGRFRYDDSIYPALRKLKEAGKTAAEAFEELGIPISVVGEDRANSLCKRAMKDSGVESLKPGSYDGTTPLEAILDEMGTAPSLELISAILARTLFLEGMLEELKKKTWSSSGRR